MVVERITEVTIENEDGFFKANLNRGGVAIGILETSRLDIPVGHPKHAQAIALTSEQLEDFFYDNYHR